MSGPCMCGDHYCGSCGNPHAPSVYRFLADTEREIHRAKGLHPSNKHLAVALMEEVGELSKALLEGHDPEKIWLEATHVACVATRIATEGDRDFTEE
jgi:hypothetical protein